VVGPGKIRSIGTATFIKFGELDNRRSERAERLRQSFDKTPIKADIPADIHEAVWEKFLLVTAFGGVGAVSRAPIGIIRTVPETRALLQQCMEEVSAVARASRIQLSDSVVSDRMSYVDSLAANATTSLQRDIAEGKPSEIEFWNGSVVRQGRAVNVLTPVNQFIYQYAAAGIVSTRKSGVSPMSRARVVIAATNSVPFVSRRVQSNWTSAVRSLIRVGTPASSEQSALG
jgi:2-dehydropantoate 2-reductase